MEINTQETKDNESLPVKRMKKIFLSGPVVIFCAVMVIAAVLLNISIKNQEGKALAISGRLKVCGFCGMPFEQQTGCIDGDVFIAGKKYDRILNAEIGPCPDCGASLGFFHHKGCDMERCPKCKGQLIGCDCDVERMARKAPSDSAKKK